MHMLGVVAAEEERILVCYRYMDSSFKKDPLILLISNFSFLSLVKTGLT